MKTMLKLLALTTAIAGCSSKETLEVSMNRVSPTGVGESIGTVSISETRDGIRFSPSLQGLTPGEHGFHLHENPSCEAAEKGGQMVPALAAGGHYDPDQTGRHEGPDGNGHLGDLPKLIVDEQGAVTVAVVAKRLKLSDLKGRTLMIHAGGDNYSDTPPMGGGGARIVCGVIK